MEQGAGARAIDEEKVEQNPVPGLEKPKPLLTKDVWGANGFGSGQGSRAAPAISTMTFGCFAVVTRSDKYIKFIGLSAMRSA